MSDLNKFGKEISEFRMGTLEYEYNFNSVGNLFFKEEPKNLNESFLKVVVKDAEYDYGKFFKFYKLDFEEFSPKPVDVTDDKNLVESYKSQISLLKSQISSSAGTPSEDSVYKIKSDIKASRDVIVALRIASGEGRTDEDFSDDFPFYLKKVTTISNK